MPIGIFVRSWITKLILCMLFWRFQSIFVTASVPIWWALYSGVRRMSPVITFNVRIECHKITRVVEIPCKWRISMEMSSNVAALNTFSGKIICHINEFKYYFIWMRCFPFGKFETISHPLISLIDSDHRLQESFTFPLQTSQLPSRDESTSFTFFPLNHDDSACRILTFPARDKKAARWTLNENVNYSEAVGWHQ